MKRLLLVALILVAAMIPCVSAFGEYSGNVTAPHWFNTTNSEANAVCAANGKTYTGDYIGVSMYWSDYTHESHVGGNADYDIYAASFSANTSWVAHYVTCNTTAPWIRYYSAGTYVIPPVADFNATPTAAAAPSYVSLLDNSTGYGISQYNWSISPASGWFASSGDLTTKDLTLYFTTPGNYSVIHGVSNLGGSDNETKTNYIQILNNTATVTMGFRAKDAFTGNIVTGATIHLHDIENASWTNSSTLRGVASITVLSGHHVSAYANATGYSDADYLNQLASPWTYDIAMIPSNYANVSAGNVTAYITVKDADTLQVVEGALVTARYQGPTQATANTNSAGMASFVVPNRSDVYFGASKSGYIAESIVLNTGTGSGGDSKVNGEIKISRSLVTTAPTVTTLPGGGTPSPTQTYLAHCDPSASDYDATKCRQSHSNSSLNFLAENMDSLIMLCVMVTMLYLMGFRLGR